MNSSPDSTALLSEMIGLIYEAAADLSLWPQLLESMSGYLELSLPAAVEAAPPSSQAERSLIHFLAPHFERAHALHLQFSDLSEERNLLENLMNRLPLGAAIIDDRGNTISLNRTIIPLLQGSALLKLVNGRLASFPAQVLEQAIEKVMCGERLDEVVRLGGDGESLSLWISRGGMPPKADKKQNRLLVLVASRTSKALSEQGLIALFGLTPAEACVTQKLALGCSLEEAAELLDISKNTAKTQLSRVFGKVGVKRQTELMQAIYASPLWLQSDFVPDGGEPLSIIARPTVEPEGPRFRLADGRWLYYSDSGDAQGYPVIFMHGIAGSRHLRHPDDDILMREGVRLIIPERPGSGDSDPQLGRSVRGWAQDIIALADHLGWEHFSVLGYSAGTVYAFALADAYPDRVRAVHIVAAMPPIDGQEDLRAYNPVFRMTLLLAKYTPTLLPALMRVMVKDIRKNVYSYLENMLRDAPEQDREVLANPLLRASLSAGLRASVRHGGHEVALEVALAARDWEIDLGKMAMPVSIWHGEADPLVSPAGARKLAKLLPHAELRLIPSAGHYLLYSHWQEILRYIKTA